MRMVSATLAGSPRQGEQLPRAFATLQKNFEGGTIHASVFLPNGARPKTFFFHPSDTPAAARQRHEAADLLADCLDASDYDAKAYLQLVETMLVMGGQAEPAPQDEEPPAKVAIDEVNMSEAIQDNIGPDAVAIIATRLRDVRAEADPTVDQQVRWFGEMMAGLVGGFESAQRTARDYGIE